MNAANNSIQEARAQARAGLDIVANAKAVLAASGYVKSDGPPFSSPHALFLALIEEQLREEDMAPIAGDDCLARRLLLHEVCAAVAAGVECDVDYLRGNGPRIFDADAALAKQRSPRAAAAIEKVAQSVASILNAGPPGEAFARRWVAYAVEQVRGSMLALDRGAE